MESGSMGVFPQARRFVRRNRARSRVRTANLDWLETTGGPSSSSIGPPRQAEVAKRHVVSRSCPPRDTVVCR